MFGQINLYFIGCFGLISVLTDASQCRSDVRNPDTIKRIVILGNSIVIHPPAPDIGWYGNWGMAASVRDSDFVHRLEHKINKSNPKIRIQYGSIVPFERSYWQYDLEQLAGYRNADICIIKISENISSDSLAERQFIKHYESLVKYLEGNGHTTVIVCEGFWPSQVNDFIRRFALSKRYDFVPLQDLYTNNPANTAHGFFENNGVAAHPSNAGMKQISDRIWEKLKIRLQN